MCEIKKDSGIINKKKFFFNIILSLCGILKHGPY